MRLQHYITELSAKKAGWKITQSSANAFNADIWTEDETVTSIGFPSVPKSDYSTHIFHVYAVRYEVIINPKYTPFHDQLKNLDRKYEIWETDFTDDKGRTKTTAKSPAIALQVFAALKEYFTKFIKERKPEVISFEGRGESKVKLYKTLAKQIERAGYKHFYYPPGSFEFVRKDLIK